MRQAVKNGVKGRTWVVNKWEHTAETTHLSSEQFDKWGQEAGRMGFKTREDY